MYEITQISSIPDPGRLLCFPSDISQRVRLTGAPHLKMATMPSHGLRHICIRRPWLGTFRYSTTLASLPSSFAEDSEQAQPDTSKPGNKPSSYFPKRGQSLELVCESLAFKGKGLCKVADTGFVVMCDRALPGERFVGRVTRKKGNYAEVCVLNVTLGAEKIQGKEKGSGILFVWVLRK